MNKETTLRRLILSKYDYLHEFASELDVHPAVITRWCKGEAIPKKRLQKVSELLGFSQTYIRECVRNGHDQYVVRENDAV